MKILIVDDSKATLEIVRRAVEAFGYRCMAIKKASSASEALKVIGDWEPQIVLTDWHMPDMTGLSLVKEISKRKLNIKIGMITTVSEHNHVEEALKAGACFVLSKPFHDNELHQHLLPLVQGVEDSQVILDEVVEVSEKLALPKPVLLEKLLHRVLHPNVALKTIKTQQFCPTTLPLLMAVFEDVESQKVRAIGLLDIYAVCVLAKPNKKISDQALQECVFSKSITQDILDACNVVLGDAALAFLDKRTRKSLRLKNTSFVVQPFEKLVTMYCRPASKRLDLSIQLAPLAQGKMTIIGF